jgi:hypothetical protein
MKPTLTNSLLYKDLVSSLSLIHEKFLDKTRESLIEAWRIRPKFPEPQSDNYVFGQNEDDHYPITLDPLRRAKWHKKDNIVYTPNDGITYFDDKHIDAGWNYVSVCNAEPNPDLNCDQTDVDLTELIKTNRPILKRQTNEYLSYTECYASTDKLLEMRSAREEERDDPEKDRATFGLPVPWKFDSELIDEILEQTSAKEEEPDNWEKNRETFYAPCAWEHEPFDHIL